MSKLVIKSDTPDEQLVYGEVYAPMRPDADGEFMTAAEIKKMAHDFIRDGKVGMVDTNHDNVLVTGASVVESFIARKGDPDFLEGAWVVGMHINDAATWAAIKKGDINGFSMEAEVLRGDPVDVTMNLPPVVTGLTSKSEEHEHTFYVGYSKEGQFLGGTTDMKNGHRHVIKGGTTTESANGHRHKFSSVDTVSIEINDLDPAK